MSDPANSRDADPIGGELPALPGYEIVAELGRGGMGVVYRARQLDSGRAVALKMIRDGALAGPQERGRFRIEAEAAARMRHPNIVRIHEIGEHAGRPYFAMDLVEGASLSAWLSAREFRTPGAEAAVVAGLLAQIAEAVQHAHDRGIVHRDLKPANILLRFETDAVDALSAGTPLVTDFSLAKRMDTESTAWTQAGAVVGTLTYMAPEQAAGRVREVGPAVDVYALGAILYELLAGRPPFQGESWSDTVQQVLHDEPPLLRGVRRDVPRELEAICLKCLEKKPEQRYASAADLAADLRRFTAGTPVSASPPSAHERLRRLAARDGYQIVSEIGRGPRSTVYEAQFEPLGQPVALKVFRAGTYSQAEWSARAARCADLAATLKHPQIIGVLRTGWWDDAAFAATEFVQLGSLSATIGGRAARAEFAAPMVAQLAEIVAYCHRQGVVHGNLKPSNVLLAANEIPRIVDFAMTSGMPRGAIGESLRTADICYVPPEMIADPAGELRQNMDIYGLGLILYELLTGAAAFNADTAADARERVVAHELPPPSAFNPHVSARLDEICMRCLDRDPWQRYTRAFELAKQLRLATELPNPADKPGRPRSGRWGPPKSQA